MGGMVNHVSQYSALPCMDKHGALVSYTVDLKMQHSYYKRPLLRIEEDNRLVNCALTRSCCMLY